VPDNTITPEHIAKGAKLENLLKQLLEEIVSTLKNNGISCEWAFNEKQGGRGNSGPDAFLTIFGINKNYYFFIESKNNSDYQWSRKLVYTKILKKFLNPKYARFDNQSETVWVLVGNTKMSAETRNYLNSHNVRVLNTGELLLNASNLEDKLYYEKLKGYFICLLSSICDIMKTQHSGYTVNLHHNDVEIRDSSGVIRNYKISQIEGNGIIFLGPKLLDCIGIGKSIRKGLKIISPWKISNNSKLLFRRRIGYGLYMSNFKQNKIIN